MLPGYKSPRRTSLLSMEPGLSTKAAWRADVAVRMQTSDEQGHVCRFHSANSRVVAFVFFRVDFSPEIGDRQIQRISWFISKIGSRIASTMVSTTKPMNRIKAGSNKPMVSSVSACMSRS